MAPRPGQQQDRGRDPAAARPQGSRSGSSSSSRAAWGVVVVAARRSAAADPEPEPPRADRRPGPRHRRRAVRAPEDMYQHLPSEEWLKPPIYRSNDTKDSKLLWWGEKSPFERNRGNLGRQLAADDRHRRRGRGGPRQDDPRPALHRGRLLADPLKALSLLNTVYDLPRRWSSSSRPPTASTGSRTAGTAPSAARAATLPVFIGWHRGPQNSRAVRCRGGARALHRRDRPGPWGEDEPRLVEEYGCTPEQLHWRRRTIVDKANSEARLLPPGVPLPLEAFIASGKPRLRPAASSGSTRPRGEDRARGARGRRARVGRLPGGRVRDAAGQVGSSDVPTGGRSGCRRPSDRLPDLLRLLGPLEPAARRRRRRVAEPETSRGARLSSSSRSTPRPASRTRPASPTSHVIQVIDHRTRQQVARLRTRRSMPTSSPAALLAAMNFNNA
jgi:hypothetical protein